MMVNYKVQDTRMLWGDCPNNKCSLDPIKTQVVSCFWVNQSWVNNAITHSVTFSHPLPSPCILAEIITPALMYRAKHITWGLIGSLILFELNCSYNWVISSLVLGKSWTCSNLFPHFNLENKLVQCVHDFPKTIHNNNKFNNNN